MEKRVTQEGKQTVIVLSDAAVAFKNTPAPIAMIEDIYSISQRRAWVIVATEPNAEGRVFEDFAAQKIEALLPTTVEYVSETHMKPVNKRGVALSWRPKTVRRPVTRKLYPGYVLVALPIDDRSKERIAFHPKGQARIFNTQRVRGILGGAYGPIAIDDADIDRIRTGSALGDFDQKRELYAAGDVIRVVDGPFASFPGVVDEVSDKDRIKVLVSIFGRSTSMQLEVDQIAKAC